MATVEQGGSGDEVLEALRFLQRPEGDPVLNHLNELFDLLGVDAQTREAVVRVLSPDSFLSPNAVKLHQELSDQYPELLRMLKGSYAYSTAFPAAGIPSQSGAIKKHVEPRFNAGIGVSKTKQGDILVHPELATLFAQLKPNHVEPAEWQRVQNAVFTYSAGLGHAWYRRLARERFLHDAQSGGEVLEKALRIDPVPVAGGTTGLDIAFALSSGPGCPVICPHTMWGNIKLKIEHHGASYVRSDFLDEEGVLHPNRLQAMLEALKAQGHSKAVVYLNFPHNPTGVMTTTEQAQALQQAISTVADDSFAVSVICDEPYYPFVRGEDAQEGPTSAFMTPGENRNMLTFVSINGTKRDGVFGPRMADLIVLTPEDLSDEAIQLLEKGVLAGWCRGTFSFPNALNQYLLARAMSGDALIPIRGAEYWDKRSFAPGMEAYRRDEESMVEGMNTVVERTLAVLQEVEGLTHVNGEADIDAAGGFFLSFMVDGLTPMEVHKAGLETNCGVIAAGPYLRVNALIGADNLGQFAENLKAALALARERKEG